MERRKKSNVKKLLVRYLSGVQSTDMRARRRVPSVTLNKISATLLTYHAKSLRMKNKISHTSGDNTMSTATIFRKGLCSLFNSVVVDILAQSRGTDKVVELLRKNFTFRASEIAGAFQKSYSYALAAIGAGLIYPDEQRRFWKTLFQVENEFLQCIEQDYLQDFAQQQELTTEALHTFRQSAVEQCKALAKLTIFQADNVPFIEAELVSFVTDTGDFAITDLVLERMPKRLDKRLLAFLKYNELLGNTILFFLHEKLRQDTRVVRTLEALQREGFLLDVREIKNIVQATEVKLNQAVANKHFGEVAQLGQELESLQQIQSMTQTHYAQYLEFSRRFANWAALLNIHIEQVLSAMGKVQWKLEGSEIKQTKKFGVADKILALVKQLLKHSELSLQMKPHDEFTQHSSASLQLIDKAQQMLKRLPRSDPQFSRIAIVLGSVVSSTGNLEQAEALFVEAHQQARNDAERGLSAFNLFQVYVRQQAYDKALSHLTEAIALNSQHHALHDVHKYPIERLLGADGRGCIFLCQQRFKKNQKVVVKCFWKTRQGLVEKVFQEPLLMAEIAEEYVPLPLDYGFYEMAKQERGFFVTEYFEGAVDGETWLKRYSKLEVETALAVGLQIAKCLQIAHEKGILHLDLKPANILLKREKTEDVSVKIIDFGLAKVAPSLGQEIVAKQSQSSLSPLAQSVVFDTLDYTSPEQLGLTRYGEVSAKSDVFAFGKTLYRLLTGESPYTLHPKRLAEAPELFDLLCDCVEIEPEKRVDVTTLISRLTVLLFPASQPVPVEKHIPHITVEKPIPHITVEKPIPHITVEKPIPQEQPIQVDKRNWWEELDDNWKKVFNTAIAIDAEPSDSDLDKIFNLQKLDCSWNELSHLEPLRPLTQLLELDCSENKLSNLEPLRWLTQLQVLNCASNKLRNLEPLRSLTQLQKLDCASNQIMDLEPLRPLTELLELVCSYNEVSDLEPLRPLTLLQKLDCTSNQISDLEPLRPLTQLQKLDCDSNQIRDLEPLGSLTLLQKLDCASNQINDFEPLHSLTQLHELIYGDNPLSQAEIEKFQKAVPKCLVNRNFG
jgi:serine/threonine protein kinase